MPEGPADAVEYGRGAASASATPDVVTRARKCVTFHANIAGLLPVLAVLCAATAQGFVARCGIGAACGAGVTILRNPEGGRGKKADALFERHLGVNAEAPRVFRQQYAGATGSFKGCCGLVGGVAAHGDDGSPDAEGADGGEDSELEIERFIEACGGWGSDVEDDGGLDGTGEVIWSSDDEDPSSVQAGRLDSQGDSLSCDKDADMAGKRVTGGGYKRTAAIPDEARANDGVSYRTPAAEEEDDGKPVPFRLITPEDKVNNLLSQRTYVKKLFRRIPQISDTTSVLVRSKAHVKGKVGSRSDLAMGNSNKVKTAETLEEPVYDGKPLYAGVYNGLTPRKHTKKRVMREIKVKVDWYAHSITHQVKNVVTFYEQLLRYIHPFQYQMLMTTIYELHHAARIKTPFDELMEELKALKADIVTRANAFNAKIGGVKKCREAFALAKAFILQLDELYAGAEAHFDLYRKFAAQFRKLPIVNNAKPIVAVVGHVNVGKSTLFQTLCEQPVPEVARVDLEAEEPSPLGLISDVLGLKWQERAAPAARRAQREVKIADYNFTTKAINVASVQYRADNFVDEGQLVDTPGLLWREQPKANPYEKLTYAALKDLPSGVVYCFDVSDPSRLGDQVRLYRALEARFPHRPWVNVVSKGRDARLLAEEVSGRDWRGDAVAGDRGGAAGAADGAAARDVRQPGRDAEGSARRARAGCGIASDISTPVCVIGPPIRTITTWPTLELGELRATAAVQHVADQKQAGKLAASALVVGSADLHQRAHGAVEVDGAVDGEALGEDAVLHELADALDQVVDAARAGGGRVEGREVAEDGAQDGDEEGGVVANQIGGVGLLVAVEIDLVEAVEGVSDVELEQSVARAGSRAGGCRGPARGQRAGRGTNLDEGLVYALAVQQVAHEALLQSVLDDVVDLVQRRAGGLDVARGHGALLGLLEDEEGLVHQSAGGDGEAVLGGGHVDGVVVDGVLEPACNRGVLEADVKGEDGLESVGGATHLAEGVAAELGVGGALHEQRAVDGGQHGAERGLVVAPEGAQAGDVGGVGAKLLGAVHARLDLRYERLDVAVGGGDEGAEAGEQKGAQHLARLSRGGHVDLAADADVVGGAQLAVDGLPLAEEEGAGAFDDALEFRAAQPSHPTRSGSAHLLADDFQVRLVRLGAGLERHCEAREELRLRGGALGAQLLDDEGAQAAHDLADVAAAGHLGHLLPVAAALGLLHGGDEPADVLAARRGVAGLVAREDSGAEIVDAADLVDDLD
ncbi:GTP-binding protein, putative [Babesia caballi]|uniref:GTP-binding protein, putative n=1 Tax=Babesia caballi TaxID=5871 RepID=A0AAV4LZA1_BABCB|nr:GTP-binding protein, putative [Babesia caballi]